METNIQIGDRIPGTGEASTFLAAAEGGGIALFVGTTRRMTGGRETDTLFYEAHESMARSECERLARQAAEQWPVLRVVIWHRIGVVPVGEASVIIGVATAHRGPAFEACRFLIDTLKEDVPIWKREHFTDGSTEWVEPGASKATP